MDYRHNPRGHNYRLANLLAEPIRVSLRDYPETVRWRREVEAIYDRECPPEWKAPPRAAVWVYDVRVPGWTDTQARSAALRLRASTGARPGFYPLHLQEEYREGAVPTFRRAGEGRMESVRASREVLYLPVERWLSPESVRRSIDELNHVVRST
jgi:dTDP-4-amino-4,6-dideoxygalactose transaminase